MIFCAYISENHINKENLTGAEELMRKRTAPPCRPEKEMPSSMDWDIKIYYSARKNSLAVRIIDAADGRSNLLLCCKRT